MDGKVLHFCVLQLLEAQAEYHRKSLSALETAIPTIQMQQGEDMLFIVRSMRVCFILQ